MRTNFNMENENITMVRGDTLSFNVEVTDENGEAVTVDSADFTCKKNAMGEENIFHKSLGAGIEQDGVLLTVRVAPNDTKDVEAGRYFYDLQLGVGDDVYTPMIGVLAIEQDVTN